MLACAFSTGCVRVSLMTCAKFAIYALQGIVGRDARDRAFYPLHPAWVAMARLVTGFGFNTLSLLGFSLLPMAIAEFG